MLRTTSALRFFAKIRAVTKPPASGYEVAELPNEKVLQEYMSFYKSKAILAILHSGHIHRNTMLRGGGTNGLGKAGGGGVGAASSISGDPVTRTFVSSINAFNFGNPDEVKITLVPGPQAPRLVEEYNILTYPTTLLFLDGKCVYRVVGARSRELSIKSLFMLRNAGRNVFSRQ